MQLIQIKMSLNQIVTGQPIIRHFIEPYLYLESVALKFNDFQRE